MANKKSAKKSKINTYLVVVVLLVVAVVAAICVLSGNAKSSVVTETVLTGTAEEKIESDGYIVRDEFVVNAPETGIVSFRSDEAERVSKDSTVAVIYSGEVSDEVKNELSGIHERLSEIEGSTVEKNLYTSDSTTGIAQITANIDAISEAVYSKDTSSVSQYKDDITRVIRKKTDNGESAMTTYEQLVKKKEELESSVSGKATAVYAPVAGVLCSSVDGYEDYLNVGCLSTIKPSYLKNVKKTQAENSDSVQKGSPCFKIVNNYEWYYTANVDEKYADGLNECLRSDSLIYLRFTDISDDKIEAYVCGVSEPEDGKVTAIIKSSGIFSGMYSVREAKAEIIRRTYKGFKVSKEAIHVDSDGSYYVFVNSEGFARRRDVSILYSDDYYAIIREQNSVANSVLLYDEVVVSGNNIEEGKSL